MGAGRGRDRDLDASRADGLGPSSGPPQPGATPGGDLDELPARELHDRAMQIAIRRLDVGFLWSLLEAIPAAEVASGHPGRAEADIMSITKLLGDVIHSREGELAEALRPLYLEYLRTHGRAP